uniref:Protein kinase domain-containing protein n=1 Tax=Arcella intermedia TaxID=1963864 RepID=A0A6B2LNJ3_9EUKA
MELLETDLEKYILSEKDKIDPKIRIRILFDIANGLNYLHNNKVIHADLKSLNILLTDENRAKICDFGAAKLKTLAGTKERIQSN